LLFAPKYHRIDKKLSENISSPGKIVRKRKISRGGPELRTEKV